MAPPTARPRTVPGRRSDGGAPSPPPPVDLATEKRNGDRVRELIRAGRLSAVHDISDGGLVLAAIEMALASGLGASLTALNHAQLFGEDQARYLVTASGDKAEAICSELRAAGVPAERAGSVTPAATLTIADGPSISLDELRSAHEGWFPAFMAGEL